MTLPSLPCYPCPHAASCCAYGTSLSDEEAAAIEANHGSGLVYKTQWGEWRTRVRKKRCVLYRDGGCSIHDKPYYPAMCRGFPWIDAETGGRYESDVTICGEFEARPELIAIQRAIPSADR
jgi:Putative zinc- or iron-chelating domain